MVVLACKQRLARDRARERIFRRVVSTCRFWHVLPPSTYRERERERGALISFPSPFPSASVVLDTQRRFRISRQNLRFSVIDTVRDNISTAIGTRRLNRDTYTQQSRSLGQMIAMRATPSVTACLVQSLATGHKSIFNRAVAVGRRSDLYHRSRSCGRVARN